MKHLVVGVADTAGDGLQNRFLQRAAQRTAALDVGRLEVGIEVQTYAFPQLVVDFGAYGVLLVAVAGHDAVLVVVVVAEHELRLVGAARDAHVMVLRKGVAAEDLVLPVDAGAAAVVAGDAVVGSGIEVSGSLVAAEHVGPVVDVSGIGLELVLVFHVVGDIEQVEFLAQLLE